MGIQNADPISRWLPPLAIAVLATIAVAGLYLGQVIFIPLALGIILSFLLQPIVRMLERGGLQRVPAVVTVVLLVSMVLAGIGWSVGGQLRDLAHDLRANQTYISNLESKIFDLRRLLGSGAMADLQATLERVGTRLEEVEGDAQTKTKVNETKVLVQAESQSQWAYMMATIGPLMGPLGTTALVVVLVIFMLISREDLRNRLIGMFGHGQLSVTTRALDDAGRRIGRYLMMQFLINASYGLALGLVLFVVGVPFALLWGLMAALLRYIPYVGPWMGAIFPIVTSLVAFEGWSQPLLVIAFIVALELISNMVIEPLLFGHSVGISAVGLILTAAFWTLLWGPIGLVMATPLTVCLVVLGQHVPRFRIFVVLLGDEPVLPPHVRFYQRLLARDQLEARELAHEQSGDTLEFQHICDQILMPAIVRARKDRYREQISVEDEAFVLQATHDILADRARSSDESKGGFLNRRSSPDATDRNAAAASDRNGSASERVTEDGLSSPEATTKKPTLRILGCAAHHKSEELAVEMLAQALGPEGYYVHSLTTKALPSEVVDLVQQQHWDAVFLAVIPPSGMPQASYLCRRLRKTFPDLKIIVGYWGNKKRFDEVLVKMRSRGASYLTTSIGQTHKQIADLALMNRSNSPSRLVRSGHATDSND